MFLDCVSREQHLARSMILHQQRLYATIIQPNILRFEDPRLQRPRSFMQPNIRLYSLRNQYASKQIQWFHEQVRRNNLLILPWDTCIKPATVSLSQYKHSSPLEHSTQKSKHANDKLFSYLQEAYLWVRARDFCIHQLQRLQVRGAAPMVDMHSKNYMNQLHSVRSIEQIRKRFTPSKWLQLLLPVPQSPVRKHEAVWCC